MRGEDKAAFDSLTNKAREHASSCTVAPFLEPMDAMFLSILMEHQKEIGSLKEVVNAGNQVLPVEVLLSSKRLSVLVKRHFPSLNYGFKEMLISTRSVM